MKPVQASSRHRKTAGGSLVGIGLLFAVVVFMPAWVRGRLAASGADDPPTFNKEVVRIFQKHCQVCHHPGDVAPFSLMTYEDAAPWATRIKEVTESRYMPPWKPVSGCGEFQGERRLSSDDIQTLARWADSGAVEGNPTELPPPITFPDGWRIGQPDAVLAPDVDFPLEGEGDDLYRCFSIPTDSYVERWVRAVEVQPGNRSVVHHVLLFVDSKGESLALDEKDPGPGYTCFGGPGFLPERGLEATQFVLGAWVPGSQPLSLADDIAYRVPAFSRIVMQVHYHRTGQRETDRTRIGLYYSNRPSNRQLMTLPLLNRRFVIPAGAERHEVKASFTIPKGVDVRIINIAPHMHLLGREMRVTATLPDGRTICLVTIDDWDFQWQGGYTFKEPIRLPSGTVFNVTAYYDNSANNPRNPNSPPIDVRWGERTVDEMCLVFIGFILDSPSASTFSRR
jgi:hypothetical protein